MTMLSPSVQQLLNHLIQVETNSAYLYLSMSNYFERLNLTGMAKWLRLQFHEELGHAQKLIDYMNDLNAVVEIRGVQEQPVSFGTPPEAWQRVLAHEEQVTQSYQQAYDMVLKAQDYQTAALFHEFLREQVEEVAQAIRIVGRLQISQADPAGLLLVDQELGQRAQREG